MNHSQWKMASVQLLDHWRKSGVSQIPKPMDQGVELAVQWLAKHASALIQDPEPEQELKTEVAVNASGSVATQAKSEEYASRVAENRQSFVSPIPVAIPPKHAQSSSEFWQSNRLEVNARLAVFQSLKEQVDACRKCEEIVCRRKQAVFGVGPVDAKLVMFGEAPGADEDRLGEPFVGAAGQLMDKILIASGLKREQVYIMNALRCRPPNNRTPTDTEIENCRPFFESQLETIQPDYIVCWGAIAVRAVLKKTESVGRLRGRFHSFRGAKVLVTYHPAYLLRNPDAKRLVWEDMKMLMREIGIPVPGKA